METAPGREPVNDLLMPVPLSTDQFADVMETPMETDVKLILTECRSPAMENAPKADVLQTKIVLRVNSA